jgi:hypothetical protein
VTVPDAAQVPRRVTLGMGVAQLLVWGPSFSLFAIVGTRIAADTGREPGWIAAGLSIGLLVAGLVLRRVGRIIDALTVAAFATLLPVLG